MAETASMATVAGYQLRERIASSETAAVWRAYDERHGRDVALKLLHPQLLADGAARRRLADEASLLRRLRHPNIVPLLDVQLTDRVTALAFPLVAGATLAERLSKSGPLAPTEAARLGADMAAALAHVHAAGIVHRDVKPANIVVCADGRARLLDFGIAAPAGADLRAEPGRRGRPVLVPGTLPYMAPEQLAGAPAQPASDVFALGCVLYEAIAGRRPYVAETPQSLAEEHRRPAPALAGAAAEVPAGLAKLIMAALDAEPRRRPTAGQLHAQLRALELDPAEAHTVVVAALPPTAQLLPAGRPRHNVLAAAVAGLIVLLAAATAGAYLVGLPSFVFGPADSRDVLGDDALLDRPTPLPSASPDTDTVTVSQPNSRSDDDRADGNKGKGERKGKGDNKGKGNDDDDRGRGRGDDD